MKRPLVSTILTTYNRAEKIVRSIQTVLGQSYKNIELIVVDDASTDNTEKVVGDINDESMRYIKHRTNKGAQAARNSGLDASKGKYKNKLSINNYFNYIKSNEEIQECINKHDLHSDWEEIRQRLNDFTHNNGKEFLRHNILELLSKNEIKNTISQITQDISFVTSFFLVVIILIKPNFIMSTDYVDSMDVGIEPPKDSQYWVAPFIKEYIDNNIVKLHPNLKSFLHHNNKYGMKIE